MRIEDQFCSHEQATKLKELGVVQRSCFCYVNNWRNPRKEPVDDGQHVIGSKDKHMTLLKGRERGVEANFVSAFTVAELGEILPKILPYPYLEYGIVLQQHFPDGKEEISYSTEYVEVYSDLDYGCVVYGGRGQTEAISRANLLIHIIEDGIVDVKTINDAYSPEEIDVF